MMEDKFNVHKRNSLEHIVCLQTCFGSLTVACKLLVHNKSTRF